MKRNSTIDTARGISILLVVLGHSWIFENENNIKLDSILRSFRMPLFFFLAGIFINTSTPWKEFLSTRANTLIKPYFVILTAFFFIWIIKPIHNGNINLSHFEYFLGVAYSTGITIAWGPMWFLTHLFVTTSFSLLLLKISEKTTYPHRLAWILSIALLTFGLTNLDTFWKPEIYNWNSLGIHGLPGLPWSIDLVPATAPFLIFGYLLKDKVKSIKWEPVHTAFATLLFIALHYFFNETLNLNYRHSGNFLIEIPQATLGIFIVINIAALIQKFKYLANTLVYMGSGSLFILIFHDYIQRNLTTILGIKILSMPTSSIISFIISITLSLFIFEVTKKNKILTKLLLPKKKIKQVSLI